MCCIILMPGAVVSTPGGDEYRGTTFWVGFLQSEVGPDEFELSLYITAEQSTHVTVKLAAVSADSRGEKDWEATYTVFPGQPTVVVVPKEYTFKAKNGKTTNRGLYIESESDVMIVAKNSSEASSDATIVIPIKSLGAEYYIMQYYVLNKKYPTQFMVLATEDSTEVEIQNVAKNSDGATPNIPYTIKLNKGEYHTIQSDKDLTGSWVKEKTGKKIAVFFGSTCAYVPKYCQSCDHLYEQALPAASWGHEFAVVPFESRDKYVLRILAKENNTYVDINGNRQEIPAAGKFLEMELTGPAYITTSRQVMVCQYSIGTRCDKKRGDPAMVMVRPLLSFSGSYTLPTMTTAHIRRYYTTIVAKTDDIEKLRLNGKKIMSDFETLPYSPSYSYAQVELYDANNKIECDCKYNFISYGFGWYESYAY